MRVIVAGAGEIGWYMAEQIPSAGHDVTVIDSDERKTAQIMANLDVRVLCGTAASAAMLTQAGVEETDLFLAVTSSDETNLVCASLARKLGAARTVARVDEVIYRKAPQISYRDHFGIDELVSPEMLTALELAAIVRNPTSLAVEHFARGTLEMQRVVADQDAQLAGTPLCELALPDGVRIASIRRGAELIIPTAHDAVEHGDQVTIVGKTEQVTQVRSGLEARKPSITKVVVMGGGHTALSLARRLRSRNIRLTVMERDAQRCEHMASLLPQATILHGDGTSLAFLKEERIDNADVFVSTTASDEANIMSAIQAKDLGAKKVLVVIHRPDYAHLVEKIGVDRAVSPRVVMAEEMLSLLNQDKVCTLATLDDGKAEILQLTVEGEGFVGHSLRDLSLPDGVLVLSLRHGRDFIVPRADTVFQPQDGILVICRPAQRKELVQLVTGSA